MKQSSARPTRKVIAGTGGGLALGTPTGEIVVYVLERLAGPLPGPIEAAVASVVALLVGAAIAYLVPPAAEDAPVSTA